MGQTSRHESNVAAAFPFRPVDDRERIVAIDVLRGFALLGILVMNIPWFAWPGEAFFNPTLAGGFDGANYGVWLTGEMLFNMKMMTIFSMLFGAGMLVMTDRATHAGRSAAAIYYRRLGWLLLIGLLHAYLLWSGDILYTYALCGLLLYPMRKMRPVTLIVLGSIVVLIGVAIMAAQGAFFAVARDGATAAREALAAGKQPTDFQQSMLQAWDGVKQEFVPDETMREAQARAYLGTYAELFVHRAFENIFVCQTLLFATMFFWRAFGPMLIGMGLMKLGVISDRRSVRFYAMLMVIGYGVGLPIVWVGAQRMLKHGFDFVAIFQADWAFNSMGSIIVALGHIGLVMLVCKLGLMKWLTSALAAVGRMALTNYLMHSLICSIIFFGWGFGQWGSLSRVQAILVVVVIWVVQLLISPWCLRRFQFGPMEWLWRSLTYWKLQPMRRLAALRSGDASASPSSGAAL